MKTLQINIPDALMERIDKLITDQGNNDYISVNSDEICGKDALLTDLLMLGLDELEVGEAEFPDDKD